MIVGRNDGGVFASYDMPEGGSVKVMNRDVYTKAMRAAGTELKRALRESSTGSASSGSRKGGA